MEIINKYINSLYKNDNSEEIVELKEELRGHLELSANEFMKQGYTEEESCEKAIDKFDIGSDMLKELYECLNKIKNNNIKLKKKIINIFRNTFIISTIICVISGSIIYMEENKFKSTSDFISKELTIIATQKDIADIKTYEKELDNIFISEEFRPIRFFQIIAPSKNTGKSEIIYSSAISVGNENLNSRDLVNRGNPIYVNDKMVARFEISMNYKMCNIANLFFAPTIILSFVTLIAYIVVIKQRNLL